MWELPGSRPSSWKSTVVVEELVTSPTSTPSLRTWYLIDVLRLSVDACHDRSIESKSELDPAGVPGVVGGKVSPVCRKTNIPRDAQFVASTPGPPIWTGVPTGRPFDQSTRQSRLSLVA